MSQLRNFYWISILILLPFSQVFSQGIHFKQLDIIGGSLSVNDARALLSVDLDQDADMDIVVGSSKDKKIAWYVQTESGFDYTIIHQGFYGVTGIDQADLDSDGDIDLLVCGHQKAFWLENNGSEVFTEHILAIQNFQFLSIAGADFDKDGDTDIVLGRADNPAILLILENDGSGSFARHEIAVACNYPNFVRVGDLNGDGYPDILADAQCWYENEGNLSFSGHQISALYYVKGLVLNDLDGDLDQDLLATFSTSNKDGIVRFDNDGSGNFTMDTIKEGDFTQYGMTVMDVDNDGNKDILSSYDAKLVWLRNESDQFNEEIELPGHQNFGLLLPADIDKDGDNDFVYTAENTEVGICYNDDQQFSKETITYNAGNISSACVIDMDMDGDLDVVTESWNQNSVAWQENDGSENYSQHIISDSLYRVRCVHAADLDRDGDSDILAADYTNIYWFSNSGSQEFLMDTLYKGSYSIDRIQAFDINDDEELDIVITSENSSYFRWLLNDGEENFTSHTLNVRNQQSAVVPADIDGDEDIDLLAAYGYYSDVIWMENIDNADFEERSIPTSYSDYQDADVEDMDGDQDLDIILVAQGYYAELLWVEMENSVPIAEHVISNTLIAPHALDVVDIDADNDMDILVVCWDLSSFPNQVLLFHQVEEGVFVEKLISTEVDNPVDVFGEDLNQDGLMDFLSVSSGDSRVAWYKQLSCPPVFLEYERNILDCADDSILLSVLSDEVASGFLWYKNGVPLPDTLDYMWATDTGTYYAEVSFDSCSSSTDEITLEHMLFATEQEISICSGDEYFAGGAYQTEEGTYYDTLLAENGCDSILITHLQLYPEYESSLDTTLCVGESYFAEGAYQTEEGTYTDYYLTRDGCDSIVVTQLSFIQCVDALHGDYSVDVRVYPNPSENLLVIEAPDYKYSDIYDESGHLLLRSENTHISMSGFDTGHYLIHIYSENNLVKIFRIAHVQP